MTEYPNFVFSGKIFPAVRDRLSKGRKVFWLLTLSFGIRFSVLSLLTLLEVPTFADENQYYFRALGYKNILSHLLSGNLPAVGDLIAAYGKGYWPPLQPFLLAINFLLFDESIFVARFVVVIISSLTTPLVYFLTRRLTTEKAATVAAFIHIFYPSFIAYSNYLWAETIFIFWLLLGIYFTVSSLDADCVNKRIKYTLLAGFFCGLAGMTKSAVLPNLCLIPLWFILTLRERLKNKIIIACVFVATSCAVLSPWQAVVIWKEKTFVPISTAGPFILWEGNNPWVPDTYGSCWPTLCRPMLKNSVQEYAERNSVSLLKAAKVLSKEYIIKNPATFFKRSIYRLRMLWASDFFLVRHCAMAIYPPLPSVVFALLWIITLVCFLTFAGLIIWGFLGPRSQLNHKGLLLLLAAGGSVPGASTIGYSRHHIPLLALMLPVAGYGFVLLSQKKSRQRIVVAMLCFSLLCLSVFTGLPIVVEHHLMPSSYYNKLIGGIGRTLKTKPIIFADGIRLRAHGNDFKDRIKITISVDDYWFTSTESSEINWDVSLKKNILKEKILSKNYTQPLKIKITSEQSGKSVVIEPITRASWWQWQPTGVGTIEYSWFPPGKFPGPIY